MKGGMYVVGPRRAYRGHPSGSTFVARLDPAAEQRAIERGDITRVREVTPSIQPGSFRLPVGWLNQQEEVQ